MPANVQEGVGAYGESRDRDEKGINRTCGGPGLLEKANRNSKIINCGNKSTATKGGSPPKRKHERSRMELTG